MLISPRWLGRSRNREDSALRPSQWRFRLDGGQRISSPPSASTNSPARNSANPTPTSLASPSSTCESSTSASSTRSCAQDIASQYKAQSLYINKMSSPETAFERFYQSASRTPSPPRNHGQTTPLQERREAKRRQNSHYHGRDRQGHGRRRRSRGRQKQAPHARCTAQNHPRALPYD